MLKRWNAWPQGIRWLVGGVAAVVLGLVIGWVLFVPAADWLAHHDVGSAKGPLLQTARDAARGRLLTLGAGLFAAAALVFTALNFNLLRRTSERTDQWQQRTYEQTEQGQVTDRYTKAIEQLGSSTVDVTIGGIYALERIARDSPTDHPTIMEVLAAFIREHSHEQWPLAGSGTNVPKRATRPDVQAALTVIGRRDPERDRQAIDLAGANLTGANLGVAEFRLVSNVAGLREIRRPSFAGADLTGADLTGANLCMADFRFANLIRANVARADLRGANLVGADLTAASLARADLRGVRLMGVGDGVTPSIVVSAVISDTNLSDAMWPEDMPAPSGWVRDAGTGLLKREAASTNDSGN